MAGIAIFYFASFAYASCPDITGQYIRHYTIDEDRTFEFQIWTAQPKGCGKLISWLKTKIRDYNGYVNAGPIEERVGGPTLYWQDDKLFDFSPQNAPACSKRGFYEQDTQKNLRYTFRWECPSLLIRYFAIPNLFINFCQLIGDYANSCLPMIFILYFSIVL